MSFPCRAFSAFLLCAVVLEISSALAGPYVVTAPEIKEANPITSEPDQFTLQFYLDNDGGIGMPFNGTDRHYTSGIKFALAHHPKWAEQLGQWIPGTHDGSRFAGGYTFGQAIYTPENLRQHELLFNDRPYAGFLYVGAFWQRADASILDNVELDFGVTGDISLASLAQRFVHQEADFQTPAGWANQLKNEPGLNLTYSRKWKFEVWKSSDSNFAIQAIPEAGATIGSFNRHAVGGATVRVGWNLPDDFGPGRIELIQSSTAFPKEGFGFYFYGRAAGRAVEHNTFLEGNTFESSHSVEERPLVGEWQVGFLLTFDDTFQFGYGYTHMTEEFYGQRSPNNFGTWTTTIFF
ncbi:MAG: lipid A deacylase LpxR family protein [Verrucomicrobiota bacterium]|nr:lipid A deacylase LpxR family protein [Verrucomicrobiota bacterium]